MPLFQPISLSTDLPPPGKGAETYNFDIKQTLDMPYEQFELAKDVSAFANGIGGIILVGAAEDKKRGVIGKYCPLKENDAKKIRDAYSQAVRDLCSPAPLINPVVLERDDGHVVAVNVWPFPGQAVGVMHDKDRRTYAFPLRTGVDTTWLTAEQIPMLMLPEMRRIIILLSSIKEDEEVELRAPPQGYNWKWAMQRVAPFENILVVRSLDAKFLGATFTIPLDAIRSVWKGSDRGWCIVYLGKLILDTNTQTFKYYIGET